MKGVEYLYCSNYFQFNNETYQQFRGSPMGSPISPILANIVLDDLEKKVLKSNTLQKPLLFKRYVDDIFMILPTCEIDKYLECFNSKNPLIQFTCGRSLNDKINFLDVTISVDRKSQKLITNWFQKSMISGRMLNFNSVQPLHQKRGIVFNLIDRALLFSDEQFHKENVSKVIKLLHDNNYPKKFIHINIRKRMRLIKLNNSNNQVSVGSRTLLRSYAQKHKIAIPFTRDLYPHLKNMLDKYNILTIPQKHRPINNIVRRGKDATPKFSKCHSVYKISCNNCKASYVGQTKRPLFQRMKEHKKRSVDTPINEHIFDKIHTFDFNNVKILDVEPNYRRRRQSEMIHISLQNQGINRQNDTKNFYINLL